jgi:hypothetical protein
MLNSNPSNKNTAKSRYEFSVSFLEKVVIIMGAVSLISAALIGLEFKTINNDDDKVTSRAKYKEKLSAETVTMKAF